MKELFNLDFADEVKLVNFCNNLKDCVNGSEDVPYCKVYAFIRDEVCKVRENGKQGFNGLAQKLIGEVADSFKNVAEYSLVVAGDELLVLSEGLDFFSSEAEGFENRDDSVVITVAAANLNDVKYAED